MISHAGADLLGAFLVCVMFGRFEAVVSWSLMSNSFDPRLLGSSSPRGLHYHLLHLSLDYQNKQTQYPSFAIFRHRRILSARCHICHSWIFESRFFLQSRFRCSTKALLYVWAFGDCGYPNCYFLSYCKALILFKNNSSTWSHESCF